MSKKRYIIGMSGATGQIYGIRLLELLRDIGDVETHLIMSDWAKQTIELETAYKAADVEKLADYSYGLNQLDASISSGSFPCQGMVILPCSIKTLSAIANSYNSNLLIRAADVSLKEKRPLILLVRETPLHLGHLQLMTKVAEYGATIFPPMPAFYNHPQSLNDLVTQTASRILDHLRIPNQYTKRWGENSEKILHLEEYAAISQFTR
jgi:4-hydroxy-3-polyprenylbenzoate decarboxylase